MKRAAVLKKIRKAARDAGVSYQEFQRTNHLGLQVGNVRTTIGRHTETAEEAAEALYRQLEPALGKGWWRR